MVAGRSAPARHSCARSTAAPPAWKIRRWSIRSSPSTSKPTSGWTSPSARLPNPSTASLRWYRMTPPSRSSAMPSSGTPRSCSRMVSSRRSGRSSPPPHRSAGAAMARPISPMCRRAISPCAMWPTSMSTPTPCRSWPSTVPPSRSGWRRAQSSSTRSIPRIQQPSGWSTRSTVPTTSMSSTGSTTRLM